jgi:hypothetical protein
VPRRSLPGRSGQHHEDGGRVAFDYKSSTSAWAATASLEKPDAAAQKIQQRATALVGESMFFPTASRAIRYHMGEVARLSFVELPRGSLSGAHVTAPGTNGGADDFTPKATIYMLLNFDQS